MFASKPQCTLVLSETSFSLVHRFHNEKLSVKISQDLRTSTMRSLACWRRSERRRLINLDERLTKITMPQDEGKLISRDPFRSVGEALFGADSREAEGCGFDEDMLISTIEKR